MAGERPWDSLRGAFLAGADGGVEDSEVGLEPVLVGARNRPFVKGRPLKSMAVSLCFCGFFMVFHGFFMSFPMILHLLDSC